MPDNIILNLLIKDPDSLKVINSQKTIAKQMTELDTLARQWSAQYQVSVQEIVNSIEMYNTAAKSLNLGQTTIDPRVIEGYKSQLAHIEEMRIKDDKEAEEAQIAAEALAIRKQVVQQRKEEEELARLNANRALKESEAATQVLTKEKERNQLIMQRRDLELNSLRQQELRSKSYAELLGMYKSGTLSGQEMLDVEVLLNAQRVKSVELAQELAVKEDVGFEKKKAQATAEQQLINFTKTYGAELKQISTLKPYQQVEQLPGFIQKVADASGVTTSEIMNLVRATKMFDGSTIKKVEQALRDVQNGAVGAAKEMFNLRTIMNTAFGVGMAMLIFQLQMLISKFFTDAIQQARDLGNALGKLSIAEQVMSKGGIEVSYQDLLKIATDLEKKFTNISNVDMLKATGDMALRLAGTGFTPDELKGLLEVANAAAIRNPEKSLEEIMGIISAGAISGQVEGVRNLGGGLSVNAPDVEAYAKRKGLIKDSIDELNTEQKQHARIGALIEQNNKSLQETLELQNNISNSNLSLDASWKNLTEKLAPLVALWQTFQMLLAENLNTLGGLITLWEIGVGIIFDYADGLIDKIIPGHTKIIDLLKQQLALLLANIFGIEKGKAIYDSFLASFQGASGYSPKDTPTGPYIPPPNGTEDNADKIAKALNDLAEAMDQFAQRAARMEEDFANTMRKLQKDFDIDKTRFWEDWAIDRQNIIDDSEEEMARKQRDYDNRKRNAEAKLQEDLRQLREKYLMNLDDALHERDARQVLRLAREYAMNKQNLINEFNISQADSAAQHKAEMDDLAKQRDDRLKALDQERALKLKRMEEDYALKKKREEEEHKLEMERLEQEKQDKLRQLAQSLAEQLGLSDEGSKAIYDLFMSYFGPKGAVPNIMKQSYETVVSYAQKMATKLQEILNKYKAVQSAVSGASSTSSNSNDWSDAGASGKNSSSSSSSSGGNSTKNRANGGLDIANTPTNLTFGEAGPEMALTVPLNQISSLGGSIGSLFAGAQAPKAELLVSLSEDLEARIVNQSLESMSNVITKIRRERQ